MLKVANDTDIQVLSEKYIHTIENDIFYIKRVLECRSLDINTNRNDLINQLEVSMFNMKELHMHLINIEDIDIENLENEIEIPLNNFNQSRFKYCEEDRYKESLHMN